MSEARARTLALVRRLRAAKLTTPRRRIPPVRPPDAVELEYFQAIRTWLDRAREAVREELGRLFGSRFDAGDDLEAERKRITPGRGRHPTGKMVNESMDRITQAFWEQTFKPREVEAVADLAARRASAFHLEQYRRQARAGLGVDVFLPEPHLAPMVDDWVAENVALIKTVPNSYFDDIEKAVTRGVREGKRHEDIAQELVERYGVAESRAGLIARDQVGKLYGRIAQERQEALGVDAFIWRTVRDNRVREEHQELDGERFLWSDPPSEGIPGEAINCRCYAEPDFSSLIGDL